LTNHLLTQDIDWLILAKISFTLAHKLLADIKVLDTVDSFSSRWFLSRIRHVRHKLFSKLEEFMEDIQRDKISSLWHKLKPWYKALEEKVYQATLKIYCFGRYLP